MQTAAPPRTRIVGPEPFRNLGFPGIVVAALVSSFFAAQIVCTLAVLILYGRHAFFVEGLRVADWKHAILSNGVRLPWWGNLMIGPPIVPVAALLIFGAEFAAGRMRTFLERKPAWTTAAARLFGGAALLGFSFWLYSPRQGAPFLLPIPLSAFIGGTVLLWKAAASVFRKPA
jgi:hypothetical protein